uniref:Uncharacterized protein n=1 Tax=Desulfovibrio sp. U5L TaxID=596152 RepID=I2PZY2_9BACT
MNRIPYDGSIDEMASCPHCGALNGEKHYVGCIDEECPQCGSLILTCGCGVLAAEDHALAVRQLYDAIDNPIAGWALAAIYPHKSPIGLAGWLWVCLHSDRDLVASLALTQVGTLASMKPSFCDVAGRPRYMVGDIARALGYDKPEVLEMEKAFAGIESLRNTEKCVRIN